MGSGSDKVVVPPTALLVLLVTIGIFQLYKKILEH